MDVSYLMIDGKEEEEAEAEEDNITGAFSNATILVDDLLLPLPNVQSWLFVGLAASMYFYIILYKKTLYFYPFVHSHLLMWLNVLLVGASIIVHDCLPQIHPLSPIFYLIWTSHAVLDYMCQFLLNMLIFQMIYLFSSDKHLEIDDRGCFYELWTDRTYQVPLRAALLLIVEIVLRIYGTFDFTASSTNIKIDTSSLLPMTCSLGMLLAWYCWWEHSGRKLRLSDDQIGHSVHAIVLVVASWAALAIHTIDQLHSDPRILALRLPIQSVHFIPHAWIVSAVLCHSDLVQDWFRRPSRAIVRQFQPDSTSAAHFREINAVEIIVNP
ncbi:unnamed protein product [Caenorhabditis sp. 36 PRJEB53466]|nr:unnamed protein product [Caenorhabditis sp. 36 PRJEB53466]